MSEEPSTTTEGQTFRVPATAKGERLDKWVAEQAPDLSRSQISKFIEEGRLLVNGEVPAKAGMKLAGNETIALTLPPPPSETPHAEAIDLDVLYEDEDVLVINKAAGVVVHPAPGHQGGTVVNALLGRYPDFSDPDQPDRPGIVHRLDRDTSGVLIIAKHPRARRFLQRQFHKRTTEKVYVALVLGQPKTMRGIRGGRWSTPYWGGIPILATPTSPTAPVLSIGWIGIPVVC